MDRILKVSNLTTQLEIQKRWYPVIEDLSFDLKEGETIGIVGESGCGKSFTARTIMGLLPSSIARIRQGTIEFSGRQLQTLTEKELQKIRGKEISMIFQDPMRSLNPLLSIGYQIEEVLKYHLNMRKKARKERAIHLISQVGIQDAEKVYHQYPHQLSGGMLQRVMIAIATACEPQILIADEPTTALDVTLQAQILDLIHELTIKNKMSVLLISHDLGVIAGHCDHVLVMYRGQIVEQATVKELFDHPLHPYTKALFHCIPSIDLEETLESIPNTVPSLDTVLEGCYFKERCPYQQPSCGKAPILLDEKAPNHFSRCLYPERT